MMIDQIGRDQIRGNLPLVIFVSLASNFPLTLTVPNDDGLTDVE